MDLGDCAKIHSAALKADYELASKKREYGYDVDVSVNNNQNKGVCSQFYYFSACFETSNKISK